MPMYTIRHRVSFSIQPSWRDLRACRCWRGEPMRGTVSGKHASPNRGASVEFAEYRKYVPGDDLRRLDWRAYGRSDRYYVKEFEADTNLRCCLVLDTSGSMDFGSGEIDQAAIRAANRGRDRLPGRPARGCGGIVLRGRRDRQTSSRHAKSGSPATAL